MKFRIPIGDWSGDGHSKVEWFIAEADGSIEDVREAYFEAATLVDPTLHPENLCASYEEHSIEPAIVTKLKELSGVDFTEDPEYVAPQEIAAYVVWFINHGNPDLSAVLLEGHDPDMLPFYGSDKKGRHIGFIGYGLFD